MTSTPPRQRGPATGEASLEAALSSVQAVTAAEERAAQSTPRDVATAAVLGAGYVVAAVAVASWAPLPDAREALLVVALTLLYALAYRTEFVAASGSAVPTQPVLVAMFLVLPVQVVPLAVLVGIHLGEVGSERRRSLGLSLLTRSLNGWHCLGPTAILWITDPGPLTGGSWPVYLAALAAQVVVDAASAAVRAWALHVPLRSLVAPLSWTFAVDSVLAALGACVALAAATPLALVFLVAAPIGLVRLLAYDREKHRKTALTLSDAYSTVHEQARHDPMTGLGNRRRWDEAVARAGTSPDEVVSVLVADLDGLKRVNDSLGHEAGDALITAMGDVMRAAAPMGAVVARLGGDEFGMLVRHNGRGMSGEMLAGLVRDRLATHEGVGGFTLSASLGWADSPPVTTVVEAVVLADQRAGEDKVRRKAGRQ